MPTLSCKTFSMAEFLSQVFIFLLCYQYGGTTTTAFTSSPSSVVNANLGENITLIWRFTLSTTDKNNFQEIVLGTRSSDGSFIKLVSVSRIGSASSPDPPEEAASFKGRVFFIGNASLSRLGEFIFTGIQESDNDKRLLCAMKIGHLYTFSGTSALSVDVASSSPSDQNLYVILGSSIAAIFVIITIAVGLVCFFKKSNAVRSQQTDVQPVEQDVHPTNDFDR